MSRKGCARAAAARHEKQVSGTTKRMRRSTIRPSPGAPSYEAAPVRINTSASVREGPCDPQRHCEDRERRVPAGRGREDAAVAGVEVVDVVEAPVGADDRGPRI